MSEEGYWNIWVRAGEGVFEGDIIVESPGSVTVISREDPAELEETVLAIIKSELKRRGVARFA